MATLDVVIPDIGDATDVEVIEIAVAPGDSVSENDLLIVIESDKASMEIPSPAAGTVQTLGVALGDQVEEGKVVATLELTGADAAPPSESGQTASEPAAAATAAVAGSTRPGGADADADASGAPARDGGARVEVRVPDVGDSQEVVVVEIAVTPGATVEADALLLVVESDKASMEIVAPTAGTVAEVAVEVDDPVEQDQLLVVLTGAAGSEAAVPAEPQPSGTTPDSRGDVEGGADRLPAPMPAAPASSASSDDQSTGVAVYAGPAVRRLARELGVRLQDVPGSGQRGRIVKDDVKVYVKTRMTQPAAGATGGGIPAVPDIDFARFGPVEMAPLSRIQQRGAQNLHRSWLNVPHVTQFDDADVTELEEFRGSLKADAERQGVRVTPLSFIVKACCHALREFPTFNASLTRDGKQFVLKRYYHIGFAVDTPDGLVVPVIRDADKLGIWELSARISELSDKARSAKLTMDELQGGTFTVSSLGAIGGTGFTPVVNAPEVAILGVARLDVRPVWDGEAFVPRKLLPLALSYDHKAINGAEGGRFMVYLRDLLEDVRRLAL